MKNSKQPINRPIKRMMLIIKRTGMRKVLIAYIISLCLGAFLITIFEPNIKDYGNALWYCFVASTTIGFGDYAAVGVIGRIVTVLVTIAGILAVAIIPGVIVSYYTEYLRIKEKETISTFLEELENLPNLSEERLKAISEKVKSFNKKK